MAERLWNEVCTRNNVMEIAETIAPIFKSFKLDEFGNPARYISVKTIDYNRKDLNDHTIILKVDVEFLSDNGSWIQPVIYKFFKSNHLFQKEMENYRILEVRCLFHDLLRPLSLIYYDTSQNLIIFKDELGERIDKSTVTEELQYFQYGILASIIQGNELMPYDYDRLYHKISRLIVKLPFTNLDKAVLIKLIKNYGRLYDGAMCGFERATEIHPKNLRYHFHKEKYEITKRDIISGRAFTVDILPVSPEEINADRIEDLARIISIKAFKEYLETETVDKTVDLIYQYLEGFELLLDSDVTKGIEQIYPNGLTLDIHILVDLWELFIRPDIDTITTEVQKELLNFSRILLERRPFQIYGSLVEA